MLGLQVVIQTRYWTCWVEYQLYYYIDANRVNRFAYFILASSIFLRPYSKRKLELSQNKLSLFYRNIQNAQKETAKENSVT